LKEQDARLSTDPASSGVARNPARWRWSVAMALRKMEGGSERKFVIEIPLRFRGLISLIAMTAAPAFVLFLLIPARLVPPVLSILSFVIACSVAMYALSTKADRDAQGSTIWNIAYAFTFTWIVAGMMSNPKHVFDWFDNLSMVP
jgi:hypothetical protein